MLILIRLTYAGLSTGSGRTEYLILSCLVPFLVSLSNHQLG